MEWLKKHEALYRALRTFLQVAVGVVVAAIVKANGAVTGAEMESVIVLAVATGLAAVMNITSSK